MRLHYIYFAFIALFLLHTKFYKFSRDKEQNTRLSTTYHGYRQIEAGALPVREQY